MKKVLKLEIGLIHVKKNSSILYKYIYKAETNN